MIFIIPVSQMKTQRYKRLSNLPKITANKEWGATISTQAI